MAEIKWDIKRGVDIYGSIFDSRLKKWISAGKIKKAEAVVWRSGFSGWRRPEELQELQIYFKRWEKFSLGRKKREKLKRKTLPQGQKEIKDILIIDDEKDLCWLLGDTLSSKGYNVEFANTKKEAMARIKKRAPDLVFLDLKLPDADGMKVLSRIKKKNPKTIVNIISAYGSQESKEEAKSKGAYSFIDKPFSESRILKSVRQFHRPRPN